MSQATCRRCSECQGQEHHWMENGNFGDGDYPQPEVAQYEYVCKHCEALGAECQACYGDGYLDDEEGSTCTNCGGEGVRAA